VIAGGRRSFRSSGRTERPKPASPAWNEEWPFHVFRLGVAEGRWIVLPFEGLPSGELRDTEYAGLCGAQLNVTSLHPKYVERQTRRDLTLALQADPKGCPTRAGKSSAISPLDIPVDEL
jgi:hypothetical protein